MIFLQSFEGTSITPLNTEEPILAYNLLAYIQNPNHINIAVAL